MIALSKKRNYGRNEVTFINEAIENVLNAESFDVAVTCFLFDNFNDRTVQKVFDHIHTLLKPNGLWLNADFQLTGKWWQQPLLNSMLFFFRILCNIESKKLPDMRSVFAKNGYRPIAEKTFFGEFILSQVYQKPNEQNSNIGPKFDIENPKSEIQNYPS
jgi:ubiquinone/menaquinone biosynthesis C-methylase UbiE